MKIKEIEALTGSAQKTIYRWMQRHPRPTTASEDSSLGHPFPRPVGKEGREVIWDDNEVDSWWQANAGLIGRHPAEKPVIIMPWASYRAAIARIPVLTPEDEEMGQTDDLAAIQRTERVGQDIRLWFGSADDAVRFKVKWS